MTDRNIRFVHMEPVNFQDFPVGGTLSFARQLIGQFREEVALVGIVTDKSDPVGKWFKKEIDGISYYYYGIGRFKKSGSRPLIPIRLQTLVYLIRHMRRIRRIGNMNVFTRSPQYVFALGMFRWNSICFCFAGIANSVEHSRYKMLRVFGNYYEKMLFRKLKNEVDVILASADSSSVEDAVKRTGRILESKDITIFPTRFDPRLFSPLDKAGCRKRINIGDDVFLLVTTGRLSWIKGWQLLVDAADSLSRDKTIRDVRLIFAGEGEDRQKLETYAAKLIDAGVIILAGKLKQQDLSVYLNAADVFVMGSHHEGWPTSLVEAMACGCTIVTTAVSAAEDIVTEGKNGYIVRNRDPREFARAILKARELRNVREFSMDIRDRYSVENLKPDLERLWLSKI